MVFFSVEWFRNEVNSMASGKGKAAARRGRLPAALLLLVILLAGAAFWGRSETASLLAPVSTDTSVRVFEVPPGATSAHVAAGLQSAGLVKNGSVFRLYLRLRGLDGRIQAGQYELAPSMPAAEVASRLTSGRVVEDSFTVPEGYTISQMADLLASRGLVDRDRFLVAARDPSLVKGLVPEGLPLKQPLEGYLFPDTYRIPRGYTEKQIVALMVDRFRQVMTPEWQKRAQDQGLTVHQVVTLASLIEREAQVPADRPVISSVFHNRLRLGMKLDSCATVNYALGKSQLILTYKDLEVNSPYNTYKNVGLPPGPIGSPGKASLEAALYPAESKYLYFVAKGDGSHAFASTLSEHLANARRYEAALSAGSQAVVP